MCVYIYIYTRSIDGVTMFRAIKTVARVDDGGASVSIRRQLTSPPGIPIRRMERWSHVGRNIAHAATLFSHQFKDYSDLWLGLHLIVEIVDSRRGERSLLAKDHAWRKKRSARLLGIRAHIDRRSLREREEIKTPIRNPSDSHVGSKASKGGGWNVIVAADIFFARSGSIVADGKGGTGVLLFISCNNRVVWRGVK